MATLEERVSALETQMATKQDLQDLKEQVESRLYTALSEMEGRFNARIDGLQSRFDAVDAQLNTLVQAIIGQSQVITEHGHGP